MDKFSFDYWSSLYDTNPAEYERQRTEYLNQHIMNAPVEYRNAMRLVQLECDTIRQLYSPMEATVKIAELMAEKLKNLKANLTELREIVEDSNDPNILL
jgi:hypothetical protein